MILASASQPGTAYTCIASQRCLAPIYVASTQLDLLGYPNHHITSNELHAASRLSHSR